MHYWCRDVTHGTVGLWSYIQGGGQCYYSGRNVLQSSGFGYFWNPCADLIPSILITGIKFEEVVLNATV